MTGFAGFGAIMTGLSVASETMSSTSWFSGPTVLTVTVVP